MVINPSAQISVTSKNLVGIAFVFGVYLLLMSIIVQIHIFDYYCFDYYCFEYIMFEIVKYYLPKEMSKGFKHEGANSKSKK